EKLEGANLNDAKAILAYETTRLAHGREEAEQAYRASTSMFGVRSISEDLLPSSTIPRGDSGEDDISVPHSRIDVEQLKTGIPAFKLYHMVGLTRSGGAARRLIEQGGGYINGRRIESFDQLITVQDLNNMEIILRAGKKRYHKIKIVENND
ncbi:tyrosine--tRNA ligase, partial [Thermodesulfobacteriota bacterium]